MTNVRPVRIKNVAIYDGKLGWFHCFGTRSYTKPKVAGVLNEIVGVIELENGSVIQLSTNRFDFLDPEKVEDVFFVKAKGESEDGDT